MRKISCRRPRAVNGAELGHFTLLFCRGRQRNAQKVKKHVHSYCFADLTFCLVTLLLSSASWFAYAPYSHAPDTQVTASQDKSRSGYGCSLPREILKTYMHFSIHVFSTDPEELSKSEKNVLRTQAPLEFCNCAAFSTSYFVLREFTCAT